MELGGSRSAFTLFIALLCVYLPRVNGYQCTCQPGWTGSECETDIDDCAGVTCPGNAECQDEEGGYSCTCLDGYYGDQCQHVKKYCKDDPCPNGGICQEGSEGHTCSCPEPFTGDQCELTGNGGMMFVKLSYFENPTDKTAAGHCCDGVGRVSCPRQDCDHFFVVCVDRKGGSENIDDCAVGQQTTDKTWNNNFLTFGDMIGKKTENPLAFPIPPGWKGEAHVKIQVRDFDGSLTDWDLVDTKTFDTKVTVNGWWADLDWRTHESKGNTFLKLQVAASCNKRWHGKKCDVFCDDDDDDDDEGHYECDRDTGEKLCHPGWSGSHCAENIDECSSKPCQHGGVCTDKLNGYTCACREGYSGAYCEVNIDECSSNPCQNGASCTLNP